LGHDNPPSAAGSKTGGKKPRGQIDPARRVEIAEIAASTRWKKVALANVV
jgi:hypothetical protein